MEKKQKYIIVAVVIIVLVAVAFVALKPKTENPINNKTQEIDKENDVNLKFDTVDIFGKQVTDDIFSKNRLTLVNVFSTGCGPCMRELPELAQLAEEMKDSDIGFVGILLDTGFDGKPDREAGDVVKKVMGKQAKYFDVIYPDNNLNQGILLEVTSIPTTYFVDSSGNIEGEAIVGAMDKEDWKKIISEK